MAAQPRVLVVIEGGEAQFIYADEPGVQVLVLNLDDLHPGLPIVEVLLPGMTPAYGLLDAFDAEHAPRALEAAYDAREVDEAEWYGEIDDATDDLDAGDAADAADAADDDQVWQAERRGLVDDDVDLATLARPVPKGERTLVAGAVADQHDADDDLLDPFDLDHPFIAEC